MCWPFVWFALCCFMLQALPHHHLVQQDWGQGIHDDALLVRVECTKQVEHHCPCPSKTATPKQVVKGVIRRLEHLHRPPVWVGQGEGNGKQRTRSEKGWQPIWQRSSRTSWWRRRRHMPNAMASRRSLASSWECKIRRLSSRRGSLWSRKLMRNKRYYMSSRTTWIPMWRTFFPTSVLACCFVQKEGGVKMRSKTEASGTDNCAFAFAVDGCKKLVERPLLLPVVAFVCNYLNVKIEFYWSR